MIFDGLHQAGKVNLRPDQKYLIVNVIECEVNLCGHATLSTAFVLFHEGHVPMDTTIHFHTR
jgi:hypothetical protein